MMAESKQRTFGFQCPVRGCSQRNNRRFISVMSLAKHMEEKHPGELQKRLRAKESKRK